MTTEQFTKLKKLTEESVTIDLNKLQTQLLEIPLLHDRYLTLFIRENKSLNFLQTQKQELYAKLYKHFKYDANERWETKHEIESQMYTDKSYVSLLSRIDDQQEIVTYLEKTIDNIKNLSFTIKNYMDWQRFLNAEYK